MSKKNKKEKELNESKKGVKDTEKSNQSNDKKNKVDAKSSDIEKNKKKGKIKEDGGKSKIKTNASPKKTFSPVKPLKKNPIITILDQHQQHRLRIAKIIGGIFILFVIVLMIYLGYRNFQKESKFEERLVAMQKKIEEYNKAIEASSGFERDRIIKDAIISTYNYEKIDWKHHKKWKKLRKEYFAKLESIVPVSGENFVQPAIAADMIAIPKGEFYMGRTQKEIRRCLDELPRRKVEISYPFWIARTEIANYQYRVFYPHYTNRSHKPVNPEKGDNQNIKDWRGYRLNSTTQPAIQVNWHLASEYCEMLTYNEKKKKRLPSGYVYRLPTEAEWEYACRAGTETYFYWGDVFGEKGAEYANCLDRNSAQYEGVPIYQESPKRDGHYVTAPVGSFKPNNFGLYDMSGNVWEWCWDWYNPKAYDQLPQINPIQISPVVSELTRRGNFEREYKFESTSKVIRGGGWLSPPFDVRSAARDSIVPEKKDIGIGFRIVLAPPVESLNSDKEKNK